MSGEVLARPARAPASEAGSQAFDLSAVIHRWRDVEHAMRGPSAHGSDFAPLCVEARRIAGELAQDPATQSRGAELALAAAQVEAAIASIEQARALVAVAAGSLCDGTAALQEAGRRVLAVLKPGAAP